MGTATALLLLCLVAPNTYASMVQITGQVAEVAPGFVSITFDWWKHDDPTYGRKWGHTGILELDLNQPDLIELARQYRGAFLRIGGSPEDSIMYVEKMSSCPSPNPLNDKRPNGYYCSQVRPYVYGCLTHQRFLDIINFAEDTGLYIIIGLNACWRRNSSSTAMDFDNVKLVLQWLSDCQKGGGCNALFGFEYGNELNGRIEGTAYGNDFVTLSNLIDTMWGNMPETSKPRLLGPDTGFSESWISDALKTGMGKRMWAMTYHQYVNCGIDTTAGVVFSQQCLGEIQKRGDEAVALVHNMTGAAGNAWIGESAEHSGGGILGQTNTFASSFYYVTQFGQASRAGLNVVARQCFAGGYYELVNHTLWQPNPDYWTGFLWRHLVDQGIMNVDLSDNYSNTVQVFSGRKGLGYTVIIVNYALSGADRTFDIKWPTDVNTKVGCVFEMSGDIHSRDVYLNGKPLQYQNGQAFPVVAGNPVNDISSYTAKATTITFITSAEGQWGNVKC